MNKKRGYLLRYIFLAAFFVVVCLIYTGRLIRYQISGQDQYVKENTSQNKYRYETIHAQRGEIFDRNGVPLVINVFTYDIHLDGGKVGS